MAAEQSITDGRSAEQLRQHYQVEKELASRLRSAPKADRRHLYSEVYDELYRRVPSHPQLTRPHSAAARAEVIAQQVQLLDRFIIADTVFMEIGAGDCALSLYLASRVRRVYAVDVSDKVLGGARQPDNFSFALSDGCSMPVPAGSITVAFSNQLMEHLHPDDAALQLMNIFNVLGNGAVYVCITPSRLSGPHDISRFFDEVATGFHLKEYTTAELARLFRKTGFSRIRVYGSVRGAYFRIPLPLVVLTEALLGRLPHGLGKRVARSRIARSLLGVQLAGVK